jgi:hypothetical protein
MKHRAKSHRTVEETQPVLVASLVEILGGHQHPVAISAGIDLSPILLTLSQPPDYRTVAASGASFAKKRADRPNEFSIHYPVDGDWVRIGLQETKENFHAVQPLGQHEWLLVRGRADGDDDANATVFDMEGRPQRSFPAGDGIQDVQATEKRHIWISYFDEGVFGDTSLGKSGVACLDPQGEILFRFNDVCGKNGLPDIADCYALNVCSDHEVWLYYYTDFPLVRLMDGQPTGVWLALPVKGCGAFAVASNRVLFCGSYDKPDSLFLLNLESSALRELTVLDKSGRPLRGFRAVARRSVVYLSTSDELYRLDINAL